MTSALLLGGHIRVRVCVCLCVYRGSTCVYCMCVYKEGDGRTDVRVVQGEEWIKGMAQGPAWRAIGNGAEEARQEERSKNSAFPDTMQNKYSVIASNQVNRKLHIMHCFNMTPYNVCSCVSELFNRQYWF